MGSRRGKCEKGCKGRILGKGDRYCNHLEKKLKSCGPKKAYREIATQHVEHFSRSLTYHFGGEPTKLVKALKTYGLEQYQIDLILLRFVENRTLREIAKELSWTDHNSVNYHLNLALKSLKERGFEIDT